jgi:hypothetical protein
VARGSCCHPEVLGGFHSTPGCKTATGRWVPVIIMITGIAVLGLLAGSLASFFRLDNGTPPTESPAGGPAGTTAPPQDAALQALATEVSALRQQVEALTARLARTPPGPAPQGPVPGGDAPG